MTEKSVGEEITGIANHGKKVVFRLTEFKDKHYLDMRNWIVDYRGELRPSGKGLCIPVDIYSAFREAFFEVDQFLLDRGLVNAEDYGLED
jgi:hypothetical protein